MQKCGDFGHVKKDGSPCGFRIPHGKTICAYHSRTPAERRDLAMKGVFNARLKQVLPENFEIGALETTADLKSFIKKMVVHVLKKPIEKWRAAEARGWFALRIEVDKVEANNKLADAVLTAQHGGQSLVFLNQFLEGGAESRRKLPGKVKVIPEDSEVAS